MLLRNQTQLILYLLYVTHILSLATFRMSSSELKFSTEVPRCGLLFIHCARYLMDFFKICKCVSYFRKSDSFFAIICFLFCEICLTLLLIGPPEIYNDFSYIYFSPLFLPLFPFSSVFWKISSVLCSQPYF